MVLLAFGGLIAFVGFVVLFAFRMPVVRFGLGLPTTFVGVALCLLAVRSADDVEHADITPYTLLAIERIALMPLAVLASVGAIAMIIAPSLAVLVRLAVGFGCLTLAAVFWLLIITNRLPERTPQVAAPDRNLQNTED